MDVEKEELKSIRIWIQLKVGFKYWGEKSLCKIVDQIGKPLQRDDAIRKRDKVQYARVLVEVQLSQDFRDHVHFVNEHGVRTQVDVHYEWKPIECQVCHLLGHDTVNCKKSKSRQQWVKKLHQNQDETYEARILAVQKGGSPQRTHDRVDQEGFQRAIRPIRVRVGQHKPINIK